jgi:hypothetical protein
MVLDERITATGVWLALLISAAAAMSAKRFAFITYRALPGDAQ